jgi:predicted  nucleic acid-binding Zn-ribbon protein
LKGIFKNYILWYNNECGTKEVLMEGNIGGVPVMPDINSSTNLRRLQVAEDQLAASFDRVEALIANNPNKLAELQNSINLIKENFSKIISIKYGVSSESVVDSLSSDKIDALIAQITALTNQINSIENDITIKTEAIANYQSQIEVLNQQIITDQANLNAATSKVSSDLSNALVAMKVNSPVGKDFQNMVINPWLSSVASGTPDVVGLQSNIHSFLDKDTALIRTLRINGILLTTYISSNIVNDSNIVVPLLSQLQNDNAQLDALNHSLQVAQAQLDSDKAALLAFQTQLNDLNSQLEIAQAKLNEAITFFNSLTPVEKTLFQELYPDVTFPV